MTNFLVFVGAAAILLLPLLLGICIGESNIERQCKNGHPIKIGVVIFQCVEKK